MYRSRGIQAWLGPGGSENENEKIRGLRGERREGKRTIDVRTEHRVPGSPIGAGFLLRNQGIQRAVERESKLVSSSTTSEGRDEKLEEGGLTSTRPNSSSPKPARPPPQPLPLRLYSRTPSTAATLRLPPSYSSRPSGRTAIPRLSKPVTSSKPKVSFVFFLFVFAPPPYARDQREGSKTHLSQCKTQPWPSGPLRS